MKNILIAAIVACFLTACASENQEPQPHGKPLTGGIRMLPYRMSPEERKRETLKREQEWRETVKRNPACPAPGTLPRKQPGICGLLRNHLRPDTRARMPRYRPSSPRRPASAREGVSRPPSPALVGSDCPQQSLLGRSPLPWSIRTSRAGLGKRRLNHRLPGKTYFFWLR